MPRGIYRVDGEIAYIELTRGYEAAIDVSSLQIILPYSWHVKKCNGKLYAETTIGNRINKRNIYMHRMLMPIDVEVVDHKNGDGLDNRLCNLRGVSQQLNTMNSMPKKNSKSPFKGVTWSKQSNKWIARIRLGNGTRKHLGSFSTDREAAFAYDDAVRLYYDDIGKTNEDLGLL